MRLPSAPATVGLVALVLTLIGFAASPAPRWIDIHWAGEVAKDAWGRWVHREDWAGAPSLPAQLDYRWLASGTRPLLVAHALGAASLPEQNTLQALQTSLARGLRLLELDVWLDDQGQLRCHHGPHPPGPRGSGDCRFEEALSLARAASAWLVLDLKTGFAATGEAVLSRLASDAEAQHVIFQLYRPHDVTLFAGWTSRRRLAGPIVTAYLARRSLNHLASHVPRLGARALAVPLYRLPALRRPLPVGLALLVHPVHDCDAARAAAWADGLYIQSRLMDSLGKGCAR